MRSDLLDDEPSLLPVSELSTRLRRLRDWLLLDCDRYLLSLAVLAVGLVIVSWLQTSGLLSVQGSAIPILYLFQVLIGSNVTLITIAITINQLVLSRELRSPRELQSELNAAEEYREAVERETDRSVIPEEPHDFLRILVENTRNRVDTLDSGALESVDPRLSAEVASLQANLDAEFSEAIARLEESPDGVFPVLSTILSADFGTRLNHSRWIREVYADDLAAGTTETLEGIEQRLEHLDIARQYFKTIYLQQELAEVSKKLIYVGLLVELIAVVTLIAVGYSAGTTFFGRYELLLPLAITINFAPLVLLSTHILRIATVARRTAAITPFITPR